MSKEDSAQKPSQTSDSCDFIGVKPLIRSLANIQPLYNTMNYQPQFYKAPNKNLFWYRNYKAASMTYGALFRQLDWHICTIKNVDWQNDIVFGHIIDPLTRFRKGLTETFFYRQDYQTLKDKFDFVNQIDLMRFVNGLTNIDKHCMSLEYVLGAAAQKIYWIPIDCDLDHQAHTLQLLEALGQIVPANVSKWWADLGRLNQSTDEEKAFYNKLNEIPVDETLRAYLDYDQCIYAAIQYYFESKTRHKENSE